MASTISAGTTSGTAIAITGDTTGNLAFQTSAGTYTQTMPNVTGTIALTSQVIGVGQTWQNVKASRSSGVTYTNSTGKPIFVSVGVGYVTNATVDGYVDGLYIGTNGVATAGGNVQMCNLIPNGSTYYFVSNNSGVFSVWLELR